MIGVASRSVIGFHCLLAFLAAFNLCHAAPPEPIRIGATVSSSGKYAEPSAMIRDGFKLWARQVNERGGLLNRPVELILLDDRSRKDLVGPLYEKLIAEEGVDLVLSPYGTPLTLAASEVAARHEFVMLACGASGEEIWNRGNKYVFGVYAVAGRYFIGFLDLIARHGCKSVAILNEDSSFARGAADGARLWAKRFGLKLPFIGDFRDGKAELPGLLQEAELAKPDALILCAYPPDCYELLRLMKASNWKPRALGMTIAPVFPNFDEKAFGMSEGVFGPSQWEPNKRIPFPGTKKFIRDFKTFTGKLPAYHAGSAYASCQILEKAVNRIGSLYHHAIREFLLSLDTVTVIGRFKVDDTGKQIGHNSLVIQWQKGKKQIVYPPRMQTAPAIID
jgi:branched-chain amino acid transport system substrate-binding protein